MSFHLYNSANNPRSEQNAQEFIGEIREQLDLGRGFIPLVGAGTSAPSGVPIIRELSLYLQRCIALALGVDVLDYHEQRDARRRWNPRVDRWPPLADPRRPQDIDWFLKVYEELQLRKSSPADPELKIFHEAIGALAEWRTSLQFLSRLDRELRGADRNETLFLHAPSQKVIDDFFLHVSTGAQPTLVHRMLAHLADDLNLDIILTTNFDELIENAFIQAGRSPRVYGVHLTSGLPPRSTLLGRPAVIKMHGFGYGLRADYTLDMPPTPEELERFVDYLRGYETTSANLPGPPRQGHPRDGHSSPFRYHLLVMGCSASDRRISSLVRHAWATLDDGFRVFWICHSTADVEKVKTLARESNVDRRGDGARCRILHHRDLGLLFLDAYQVLTQSLPSDGLVFPSQSRLPIPPLPVHVGKTSHESEGSGGDRERLSRGVEAVKDELKELKIRTDTVKQLSDRIRTVQGRHFRGARLVVATACAEKLRGVSPNEAASEQGNKDKPAEEGSSGSEPVVGITAVATEVFEEFDAANQHCLWLDMNDVSGTDDLFEQLLDAVCYRAGVEDWLPVYLEKDARSRSAELDRITRSSGRNWLIVLNARETPGSNFGRESQRSEGSWRSGRRANGWLDRRIGTQPASDDDVAKEDPEEGGSADAFLGLIKELTGPDCPNVTVVLVCRAPESGSVEESGLLSLLEEEGRRPQSGFPMESWVVLGASCFRFDLARTVREAVLWCDPGPASDPEENTADEKGREHEIARRQRFLQALVLMQRTRLLANVWHRSFQAGDGPAFELKAKEVRDWTEELEIRHVVRRKTGGFLWMHTPTRESVRALLDHAVPMQSDGEPRKPIQGPFGDIPVDGLEKILGSWNAVAQKPEIHRHLADWYKRVFLASHSPGAAFEAVYHACASTRAALTPPDMSAVDAARVFEPLDFAESLLREAADVIRVRGFSRGSCRQLKRIMDDVEDLNKSPAKELTRASAGPTELLENVLLRLQKHCLILMRGIAREVGENTKGYERHAALRRLVMEKPLLYDPARNILLSESVVSDREAFEKWAIAATKSLADRGPGDGQVDEHSTDPLSLWVRWWRWLGRLGRASRSYTKAEHSLLRIMYAIGAGDGRPSERDYGVIEPGSSPAELKDLLKSVQVELKSARPRVLGVQVRDPGLLRLEVFKALEEYLQLLLVADYLLSQLSGGGDRPLTDPDDVAAADHSSSQSSGGGDHRLLDHAEDIAAEAERLLDGLITSPEAERRGWGSKLRIRRIYLQTHTSILSARRRPDRFVSAARMLTHAECELVQVDPLRRSPAAGIIALHRAELELEKGYASKADGRDAYGISFGEYWAAVRRQKDGKLRLPGQAGGGAESGIDITAPDGLGGLAIWVRDLTWSKATASLQNASTALDGAYPILFNRRKNVWWATWYFQRRLRVMELQLWASLGAEGQPIPFLGLEYAPRRTNTAADQMLEDTLRMVRLDVYRLATVVDSYAGCVWALHLRLAIDRLAVPMPHRQREMNQRLRDAIERLSRIAKDRQASGRRESTDGETGGRYTASNAADRKVKEYVRQVTRFAQNVATLTRRA